MTDKVLLSIGECMVELSEGDAGQLRKGFAGDCFNAAYYARLTLPPDWRVEFLSAVGTDRISDEMLAFMAERHVGTRHVARLPDRSVGLYMVHLDQGERSFSYWRSTSAARRLADNPDRLAHAIGEAGIIIFSGITLAVLEGNGRRILLEAMGKAKAEGRIVAFDPNIRPRLWENPHVMRQTIEDGARAATIVLPSFDDEAAHFGDMDIEATIARYRALSAGGVIVKNGAAGITLAFGNGRSFVPAVPVETVVDTTSAGDSFTGAFLSHFALNGDAVSAASFAASVASAVLGQHGAIIEHGLGLW